MAKTIDLDAIKQLTWTIKTTYSAANIITYNLALGASGTDLSLVYENHPSFHPLPTFACLPVISIMGPVTQSMSTFLPKFKPHNHVHGEHYLELFAPFPKAATLHTTAQIVDVVARRTGVTVAVGISTCDAATGTKLAYNEWTSFILGVPGAGASDTPTPRGSATASHSIPARPPDAVLSHPTSAEQGALYRAASGDLNPLHIDPGVARAGGFPGPLLTGTCTVGIGVRHVVEAFGGRVRSVKVRLARPVFPGEAVRTEMWGEGGGKRVVYRQVVGRGKEERVIISNAAVEFGVDDDGGAEGAKL